MNSIRIGRILDIKIELHSSFVLLILLILVLLALFDPKNFIPSLILLFFLFVSVFIHELFHSLVAVAKGIRVEKIVLLPIGGISFTEELPEKPLDEFLMAVAGPLFNFLVVGMIWFLVSFFPQLPWPWYLFSKKFSAVLVEQAINNYPLFALFWVNLLLGAFNLFLPALPLDGGRVFRAILAKLFGFNTATEVAARVSSLIAIFLFLLGFFAGNIILLIIAVFVFFGARSEREFAAIKNVLKGASLEQIIERHPRILGKELSLKQAFEEMNKWNKTAFLVALAQGFGVIDAEALEEFPKEKWDKTRLEQVLKRVPAIDIHTDAAKLFTSMISKNYSLIPVTEHTHFVGVISETELNKFYSLLKVSKK